MFQKDHSDRRKVDEIEVIKHKVGRIFKGQAKPKRLERGEKNEVGEEDRIYLKNIWEVQLTSCGAWMKSNE